MNESGVCFSLDVVTRSGAKRVVRQVRTTVQSSQASARKAEILYGFIFSVFSDVLQPPSNRVGATTWRILQGRPPTPFRQWRRPFQSI